MLNLFSTLEVVLSIAVSSELQSRNVHKSSSDDEIRLLDAREKNMHTKYCACV